MPNLLHSLFGITEASSGRRPQMFEYRGINWSAPTAYNMLLCLPMWEPPGVPAFDLGPLRRVGQPTLGPVLRTQDTYFGDVYYGDNATANPNGTPRGYNFGYIHELNFGLGPRAFSLSFWFNMPVGFAPSTDVYLMTFDDPLQTNFPGFAVSWDTTQVWAVNTGNVTTPDAGHKSTTGFNDGRWHHLAFSHTPGSVGTFSAQNTYFIDGVRNATYTGDATIGPVGTATNFYIGTDDDGIHQPFYGQFCDLRVYQDALSDDRAASMFHPDTRWEIYYPPKRAFFLPPPEPVVVNPPGLRITLQAVERAGSF